MILIFSHGVCFGQDDDVWVGVFIWNKTGQKEASYWMGKMSKFDYDGIVSGSKKDGMFALKSACWLKYDDDTVSSVQEQEDDYETDVMLFRVEKLDRMNQLKGDPRIIFKEKRKKPKIESPKDVNDGTKY